MIELRTAEILSSVGSKTEQITQIINNRSNELSDVLTGKASEITAQFEQHSMSIAATLESRAAKIDSPRGAFTISKSHNPVQDIYLRKVVGKENVLEGVASKALADPGLGCKM